MVFINQRQYSESFKSLEQKGFKNIDVGISVFGRKQSPASKFVRQVEPCGLHSIYRREYSLYLRQMCICFQKGEENSEPLLIKNVWESSLLRKRIYDNNYICVVLDEPQ